MEKKHCLIFLKKCKSIWSLGIFLIQQIEEFLRCIENTRKPTTDINEAVNVQVVLDMIDKELKEKYALPENMENNTAMLHIYCPELVKVFKTILSKKELDTALKEIEIFRPITINYFKADNFLNENVTNKLIEAHYSPWMTKIKNELIESNQSSFSSGFTNELDKRFNNTISRGHLRNFFE